MGGGISGREAAPPIGSFEPRLYERFTRPERWQVGKAYARLTTPSSIASKRNQNLRWKAKQAYSSAGAIWVPGAALFWFVGGVILGSPQGMASRAIGFASVGIGVAFATTAILRLIQVRRAFR